MQAATQELFQVAGLGRRVVAAVIDMVAIILCVAIVLDIGAALGLLELPEPNTTNPFRLDLVAAQAAQEEFPAWVPFLTYGLVFAYYALLEGLTGTTLGKRALRMRVAMDDGRRVTPAAAVMRNLIRIPELFFLYIPSIISCAVTSRRKRLGDLVAHTAVVRLGVRASAATGAPGHPEPAAPLAPPGVGSPPPSAPPPAPSLDLPDALTRLKTATLATRGAHDAFLHFSAQELARQGMRQEGGDEPDYAPEYVSAWYSLADAVHEFNEAYAAATERAARVGTTLTAALATQPDVVFALHQLEPYRNANIDEHLHDAYVQVVRAESAG